MTLTIKSKNGTELIDITAEVGREVASAGITEGFCMLFVPHTTAAVTINESADPSVKADMLTVLNKVIPWEAGYRHLEGNSAAHIKTSIIGSSELVAIEKGRMVLGTWQGIFFCEFDGPRTRKLNLHFIIGKKNG